VAEAEQRASESGRGLNEPGSKIVPHTQPRKITRIFNYLQHRVISLSNFALRRSVAAALTRD
jgi:hypothetical protein